MKGRPWVIIIFCTVFLVFAGYFAAFRFFDINGRAGRYISEKISEKLGADLSDFSVSVTPWAIKLKNVKLHINEHPLVIEAKSLSVGFNLFSFLANGRWEIGAGIYLDRPVFRWFIGKDLSFKKDDLKNNIELNIKNFPSLQFFVENGSVVFQNGDSTFVVSDRMSGWIDGFRKGDVEINFQSRILSRKINTTCKGYISRENDMFRMEINSDKLDLSSPGINLLTGDIIPGSGNASFTVLVSKEKGKLGLTGEYSIDNGSFSLKNGNFLISDIAARGKMDDKGITFDTVVGKVLGVQPELQGFISFSPEPSLSLKLKAGNVNLTGFSSELFPDYKEYPEGIFDLAADVDGPLKNLKVKAELKSKSVEFMKNRISNIVMNVRLEPDFIDVENYSAVYKGYVFKGNGVTRGGIRKGYNDFLLNCFMNKYGEKGNSISARLNGKANPSDKTFSTDFTVKIPRESTSISGKMSYNKENLKFTFGDGKIFLDGSADDIFGNPKINSSYKLTDTAILNYFGRNDNFIINGDGKITGYPEELNLDGDLSLIWDKNINTMFKGKAIIRDILKPGSSFTLDGEMYENRIRYSKPLNWAVSAESDTNGIKFSAIDKSGVSLAIKVSTTDGSVDGVLDMKDYPLENLIDFFREGEFPEKGILNGKANVSGKINKIHFDTTEPVKADKLVLAGLDSLTGTCLVSGGFDNLDFREVVIFRKGIKAFTASGRWNKGTPFVLNAKGEKSNLACIGDIIDVKRKTDGLADFDLTMIFTREEGTVDGKFKIEDGHFLDVPFDTASGRFEGGSKGFRVMDIKALKAGLFTARGEASSGYFWQNNTERTGLMLSAALEGNIMKVIPHLTNAVIDASGQGTVTVSMGGTWQEPVILDGAITVSKGMIKPSFLFDSLTNINGQVMIDPEFNTISGLRAVRIESMSASVEGRRLVVNNVQIGDEKWEKIKKPGLLNVTLDLLNLDFGVFTGRFEETKSRENNLTLYVPGFMREDETGIFSVSRNQGDEFIVGASENGEIMSPYISGTVLIVSGDIRYPLLPVDEKKNEDGNEFLEDIFWDVSVESGPNVNYVNEKNFALGRFAGTTLWKNELKIDENSLFNIYGRISDGSFRVTGTARSTYGTVTYYGYNFDIEWAELELDTANISKPSILTGRAKTITIDDQTGIETEIYLNINFIDRESGQTTEARGRAMISDDDYRSMSRPQTRFDAGPLGILELKFTSSNPSDDTNDKIWARLGISVENIGTAATRAFTTGIDNYYFNPLLRPFEESLKRIFKIDMVRITPSFLGNFAQSRLSTSRVNDPSTNYILFDRSRIMFGEFFMDDWFLSYVGQYGVGKDFLDRREKGFYHDLGLQYMIERNLRLQFHYTYDQIIRQPDKHFELRYDFRFD